MRSTPVWGWLVAVWVGACGSPPAAPGATANVALGTAVGLYRYHQGDCKRRSNTGGAECFRGGYPHEDQGSVRIESSRVPADAGVGEGPSDGAAGCSFPRSGTELLADWTQVQAGRTYSLVLEYRGEWTPLSPSVGSATVLRLTNVEDYPEFSDHSARLGVELRLKSREVRSDRAETFSLVEWTARIERVCHLIEPGS